MFPKQRFDRREGGGGDDVAGIVAQFREAREEVVNPIANPLDLKKRNGRFTVKIPSAGGVDIIYLRCGQEFSQMSATRGKLRLNRRQS